MKVLARVFDWRRARGAGLAVVLCCAASALAIPPGNTPNGDTPKSSPPAAAAADVSTPATSAAAAPATPAPVSNSTAAPAAAPAAASGNTAATVTDGTGNLADASSGNAAADSFGASTQAGSMEGTPGLWNAQFAETLAAGQVSGDFFVQRYSRNPGAMVFTDFQAGFAVGLTSRLELSFSTTAGRRLGLNSPDELAPNGTFTPGNPNPLAPFATQPVSWGPVGWTLGLTGNILSQSRGDAIGLGLQFTAELPYDHGMSSLDHYGVSNGEPTFTGMLLLDKNVGSGELVGNIGVSHTESIPPQNVTVVPPYSFGSDIPWTVGFDIPTQARLQGIAELDGDMPFGGSTYVNDYGANSPVDLTLGGRLFVSNWFALNAGYRLATNQDDLNRSGFVFGISMGPAPHAPAPPPPPPPAPPALTCSADHTVVAPGTPVQITCAVTPQGPAYTWSWTATGGGLTPNDAQAAWNSTAVAPGMYSVHTKVTNPAGASAEASTPIEVRVPPQHPPTATCAVDPATVRPGASVSLTASGTSPDQRPLTYAWTATAGQVAAPGQPGTTLDTTGVPPGTVTATAVVTDDRGLAARCSSDITVQAPPPPPPAVLASSLQFKPDSSRVDNAAKAALDDIALRLGQDPGATAVIVGYATGTEVSGRRPLADAAVTRLAQERAVNAKDYLVREKGISADRVGVRYDTSAPGKADVWIVPQGATYNGPGQTFDESAVKPTGGA